MTDDVFSQVTTVGWFGRLKASIGSVVVGLIFFLVSFPLLFWNEGRAVTTYRSLEEGAKAVVSVSPDKVDAAQEGRFVHVSGPAITEDRLTDERFGVSTVALRLERRVEMFQWTEEEETETEDAGGGKTRTRKTYHYEREWSDRWHDSARFERPDAHANPPGGLPFESRTWTASSAFLGAFQLTAELIEMLHETEALAPPAEAVAALSAHAGRPPRVQADWIYYGADPSRPEVGDVRVGFRVVRPQAVSVLAQQVGSTFQRYQTKAGDALLRLEAGTHGAAEMIQAARRENAIFTWIVRVMGLVLMSGGVFLVFHPLVVLADVLPVVGDMLGAGIGCFAAVVGLALTFITVGLSWVFYRPLLGVPLLIAAVGGLALVKMRGAGRKAAGAA